MVVVVGLLIPKLSELTKVYPKYRNKPRGTSSFSLSVYKMRS